MARKPRLHVPDGLYHVILRGNARQDVFFDAADRAAFYALIAEDVKRFGYRVHAFWLMANHPHLTSPGWVRHRIAHKFCLLSNQCRLP